MTADKRTVATDALETLGTLIGPGEKRDAIHLAVEPVVAAVTLHPGQEVALSAVGLGVPANPASAPAVGIVDPFLKERVQKGDRFWLVVMPRQISSLRHVWEHPAFPPSGETQVQEKPVQKRPLPKATVPGVRRTALDVALTPTPAPTPVPASAESVAWLREYAQKLDVELEELIDHASAYVLGGSYWTDGGRFEGVYLDDTFWDHYEKYTGRDVRDSDRGNFFSCSC